MISHPDWQSPAVSDTLIPPPSLRSFGARLAALPPERVLNTEELTQLFGVNHNGITRAVKRGDLPPPATIFGCHIWTVRVILAHIDALLEQARKDGGPRSTTACHQNQNTLWREYSYGWGTQTRQWDLARLVRGP